MSYLRSVQEQVTITCFPDANLLYRKGKATIADVAALCASRALQPVRLTKVG